MKFRFSNDLRPGRSGVLIPVLVCSAALWIPARAQTKVDLGKQGRNLDFSQASSTKPARAGNGLPSTCSVGEIYFRYDTTAGQNVYGCTSTNTWSLLGDGGSGGGGAASFGGLTDLKITLGGSTYTVATGAARFGNVTTTISSATLAVSGGSDTGTLRFYVDYNSGSPQLACMKPGTFAGTYTPTGMSCVTGTAFPDHSIPLATADISSGSPQTPLELRASQGIGPVPVAGTNMVSSVSNGGRSVTLGVDTAVVPQYSSGSGAPSGNCTTGRDFYTRTGTGHLYACTATNTWTDVTGSGGGGTNTFDYSKYSVSDRFSNDFNASGQLGGLGWRTSTQGSGTLTGAATEANWNGGYRLSSNSSSASGYGIYLRSVAQAANQGWNNLTTQAWQADWLFRTPQGTATGARYFVGLYDDPGSPTGTGSRNFLRLEYTQGTDTNWIAQLDNGGSVSTACTGSEAPGSSNYYVLRMSGAGTSTIAVQLLKSTSNFSAASSGADIFSSCTVTLPNVSSGYSPLFYTDNQASSTLVTLQTSGFFAEITY